VILNPPMIRRGLVAAAVLGVVFHLTGCLDDEARGIAWSPDGEAIAWVQSGRLIIQDMETAERVTASITPATDELAWFHDSSGVVAITRESGRWQIVRVDRTGEVSTLSESPQRIGAPLIDPGDRLILHAEFSWEGAEIRGLLDGGCSELLGGNDDQRPLAQSDDGRYLVHLSREGGQPDLWVHDFELGVGTRLTEDESIETMARWLPNSRSVIFAAQRGPRASVWLADAADPDPRRLWRGDGVVTDLEWRPDGEEIFFCAGGDLHRITSRGRRHRVWAGMGRAVHSVAVSPGGDRLALAGEGEPALLAADWGRPMPLSGDFEEALEMAGAWAECRDDEESRLALEQWADSEEDAAHRARIRGRYARVLIETGSPMGGLSQLSDALRESTPADPELHRLVGEAMLLERGDSPRALIAFRNHQAERLRLSPSDEPLPLAALAVLEEDRENHDPVLVSTYVEFAQAARAGRWSEVPDLFTALLLLAPDLAESFAAEARQIFDEMTADPSASSLTVAELGGALLAHIDEPEERWEIQHRMIRSLLGSPHWREAPRAMAAVLNEHDEIDGFREMLADAAISLLEESQGGAHSGLPPSELVPRVWRSAFVRTALQRFGTGTDQLAAEALVVWSHFLAGDTAQMSSARTRLRDLAQRVHTPGAPAMGSEMGILADTLFGFQMLRDENPRVARMAFEASLSALCELASTEVQPSDPSLLEAAVVIVTEQCALLEALDGDEEALHGLSGDWQLLPWIALRQPLEQALPLPATPRRETPDFESGPGERALEMAEELTRAAERAESLPLCDHLRLGQALAMEAAGDVPGALSILRRVAERSELSAIRRRALWQIARVHRSLGDEWLRREALGRWLSQDPTDLEWAISERWEDANVEGQ